MPTDRYFRRRMAIDKFNNRPPFDLKKLDDCTSTKNNEQDIPDATSKCYNGEQKKFNSAQKSYRNVVRYFEEIDGKFQNSKKNKNKNIIPKIIQSFQKVTPKRDSRLIERRQKTDSLHTLYRYNSPSLGKNIPNHKIMKNLLQDLDTENKKVNNENPYFDIIPSRDTNTSAGYKISKRSAEGELKTRINKQTSTTGLVWPIISNTADKSQTNLDISKSNTLHRNTAKIKSKIPHLREIHVDKIYTNNNKPINKHYSVENKISASSSELEYFPTRDNLNLPCQKKIENPAKCSNKQNVHPVNGIKEFPKYKPSTRPEGLRKEQTYVVQVDKNNSSNDKIEKKKKEKSFVQVQVEKYNKINTGKNLCKSHVSGNNKKNFQEIRRNVTKNYIDLMTSMRETLPNMGEQCTPDCVGENQEWSDHVIEADAEIKFPKETRNAMENLLENSKRIPLTKYTKSQNIQIQPAISIASQSKTDYGDYKKSAGVSYKKMHNMPCTKNLLCSRGNHDGPCTRPEKAAPPRCTDHHRARPRHRDLK